MVESVFLVLQFIGLAVLFAWAWRNDRVGDAGRTIGLLAMNEPEPSAPAPSAAPRRPGWRSSLRRRARG